MSEKPSASRSKRHSRASRQDGADTRAHLLKVAGQVFAEHGNAGTSSKEIWLRAGVNLAAVNYHFGSRDGLYEAVLLEAHQQIVSLDKLIAFADGTADARDKLRAVLAHLVGQATQRGGSWGLRVLLRELTTPSPLVPTLIAQAIQPKAAVLLKLIAEILELPVNHPAVQRGLALTLLPCAGLMIAPTELRSRIPPAVIQEADALLEDIALYALAGLDALAQRYRAPSGPEHD